LAFSWVEAEEAQHPRPSRVIVGRARQSTVPASPIAAPPSDLAYVLGQLNKLKLTKWDLALRRQEAASLSAGELRQLALALRAASGKPQ
jgi:hypothetical protein